MAKTNKPFATLGKHLRSAREQAKRSLAEVSGAVEVEENYLKLVEEGLKRPDEDVMLLLINYFNMADQQALHIWELADYESDLTEHLDINNAKKVDSHPINQMISQPMLLVMAMDIKTLYSDGVEITWNEAGLTLNFTQTNPHNSKTNKSIQVPISRIGMSYDQAEKVLKCLQTALLHAKYSGPVKLLPPDTSKHN